MRHPDKIPQGLDAWLDGFVGRYKRRKQIVTVLAERAGKISKEAKGLSSLSDRRLKERLATFQYCFRRQNKDAEIHLDAAFAVLVAVAQRTLGVTPFAVQIMGGIALYHGQLAEMETGEGKSLTACLPAAISCWSGRPCHIITVNDYLADRDAAAMRPFYHYCGVSTGYVNTEMSPEDRQLNYGKDLVYTTSKELLADFLRDQIKLGDRRNPARRLIQSLKHQPGGADDQLVMRGLDTVIVDEADSVLIDEAVTPLIISTTTENKPLEEVSNRAFILASELRLDEDYRVNERYREVVLTESGIQKIADKAQSLPGIWQGERRRLEVVKQALTARELYKINKHYVVQDGKIVIVDEFTGRLMPNRSWSHGLHQAIEAFEGVEMSSPTETLARLSFQHFFRLFRKISGMTGTAREAAGEFWYIYGLPVISIPTNRPCRRELLPDQVFATGRQKWRAIVKEVKMRHQSGRPILIGTRSVKDSERLAEMLTLHGLEYNLLNAVRHEQEAAIIAAAGERGRITIATNMAGRGTDIKLGKGIAKLGGMHVIAAERHESGRIDRQLFGRCARQGDAGSGQAFMAADDELLQHHLPKIMRKPLVRALNNETMGAVPLAKTALAMAQKSAQRQAFLQRKNVLRTDVWLEESLSFAGASGGSQ